MGPLSESDERQPGGQWCWCPEVPEWQRPHDCAEDHPRRSQCRADGAHVHPLNAAHEAVPVPGTVRVAEGPDAGQPAPLDSHRPVEADCRCGGTIRRETWVPIGTGGEWRHTGTRP